MSKLRINITDEQGILLGQIELTREELSAANRSTMGAVALVDYIASEAGGRFASAPAAAHDHRARFCKDRPTGEWVPGYRCHRCEPPARITTAPAAS